VNRVLLCAETLPDETRTALVPAHVKALCEMGYELYVQNDAGLTIGFTDDDYKEAGAKIVKTFRRAMITAISSCG